MKKTKRMLALLLTLCMVLSLLPVGAGAANVSGTTGTITLSENTTISGIVTVSGLITISGNVTLSGGGTLKRAAGYEGAILSINSGSSLTIGNVTVDGGAVWENGITGENTGLTAGKKGQLVIVSGALTLNSGAVLQNNHIALGPQFGGAVNISGGTMTMNAGSTISGNKLSATGNHEGAAVYVGGLLTMHGGEITNNYSAQHEAEPTVPFKLNGIVYSHSGTIEMDGDASITKNYCSRGAVYVGFAASLKVSGNVQIAGNYALDGTSGVNVFLYYGDGSLGELKVTGNLSPTANIGVTASKYGKNAETSNSERMKKGTIIGYTTADATGLDRIYQDTANYIQGDGSVGGRGGTPVANKEQHAISKNPADNGGLLDTSFPNDLIWVAKTFSVTHTLTNITATGATGANAAIAGTDYVAKLTPAAGYTLPADSAVTVTVGGAAKTGLCSGGTVTIPAAQVTGDIVIQAAGVAKKYDVTAAETHVTVTNKGSNVATQDQQYTTTITASPGYENPTITGITVGNAAINDYTFTGGTLTIPGNKVTGNIHIVATATAKAYNASAVITHGSATNLGNGKVTQNVAYTATISADKGYDLPTSVTVTVAGGASLVSADIYNATTGVITIPADKVTGDIHIVAVAVPKQLDAKHVLTGVTASKGDGKITAGTDYSVTLTAAETYVLPDTVEVKIGGSTLTAGANTYTYTKGTGVVTVKGTAIVDNLTITANGIKTYAVTHTTENITYIGEATARNDKDYTDKLTATGGYLLPKGITVTVGDKPIEPGTNTYSYSKDNGAISIHASAITGDIHITAVPQMEVTLIVGPTKIEPVTYPSPVTPPKITKVVQKNTETVVTPTGEGGFKYISTDGGEYGPNVTPPTEVGKYKLVITIDDPEYIGSIELPFEIKPKPITSTVTATNRAYDGTKDVAVSSLALEGVEPADKALVTVTGGSKVGTVADANVGENKSVTLTGGNYSLTGDKAGNYALTQPTGTVVTITPALYTYTIADADKTREVDKLTLPKTLTAPNAGKGVGEEAVPGSYEWFTDAGGTKKATEPLKEDSILYCKFTPTAKETVSGNKNYVDTPTIVPVTVLLKKATVTITGELPATFTYPDPITPPTKVVVKHEEKVVNPTGEYVYTFEGREGSTYGPTIVPPTDPGKYNLTIKLIGDPDYQGESGKMPFEIKPKTLTVSVTATHKVYDGNTTVAVTAGPLVGAKPGDDVKLTGGAATGTAADKDVGTDKAVTLTGYTLGGKKAGNYTLTPPVATVNITPAPFTYEVPTTQTVQTGTTKTGLVAPSTGTGVDAETVPGTSKWYKDPGCTTEITEPFTTEVTVYHKFVPSVTDPNKNYVGQPVTPVRVIVTKKEVVTITDPGITTEYTGVAIADPVPTTDPTPLVTPTWEYTYTGTDGSGKAYGPSTVRPTLVGEYRVTIKVTTETQQGEASFPFQINPAPLTVPGITATGTPGETRVTLVNTGATLDGVKAPDEGKVSLVSNKATGTVPDGKLGIDKTVTCVDYAITGEKAFCYALTQPGYVTANITGDLRIGTVADEAYTGSPLTPKPAVWFGKLLLTPGTDYNEPMTYTGNTAVGPATIKVTGKGAFAGKTAETVFQITKVTPNGTPFYEGTVKEGDTLADLHIGTGAGKRFTHPTTGIYVPGTVIWVDDKGEALPTTTPVTKGTAYRWKFTPTDGTNYEGTAGKAIPKLVGNPYIGIVVLSDAPTLGIPGANVRLVKGSTVFAETVSTVGGRFRFEAVPDGTYNIIGEKDVGGKLRTVTALVTITGGKPDLSTLILPNAEVSAVIETAPGQGKDKDNNPIEIKTPDVVVGGLETPTEEANKRITVKLTVRAKDEKTADQTAMAEIAVLKTAMAKDKTLGLVLDMDIVKRTTTISGGALTTTTTEAITETDDLLEILIPLPQELQGKGTYIILRHHEGEGAISISESPNAAGEYLTLNSARDLITLHARKFSTYAVYSGAAPYSPDPGTGTGTKSKLVVVDAKGGKLTADPAAPATGETVTITVTTEKGYFLEKLLVTGPDGVAVDFRSNGDGTYSFPMPKGRTKVTAEYKKASPANTGVAEKLITDDHILYLIGDDLGTFRPEANMNRAEVAQMFFRLMKNPEQLDKTAKLADVPAGAWYAGPVNAMVNAGIFTGYVDGSFRPEAQITRAEFVAVAARFAKANPGAVRFADLPKEHWAFSAIATAVAYGWVDGYEDGSFKPGANITRSEVTKIVNAMLGRAADKAFVDAGNGLRLFPDADKSHWAFYEIVEATNKHNFKLVNDSETWSK